MDLPGIACGGNFHHVKADAGVCIRAVLQVVLGRQNQAALFAGIHGRGWGIQHAARPSLDLGKDELAKHKGYPTKLHYELIARYGIQPFYRRSFLKKQGYWHD